MHKINKLQGYILVENGLEDTGRGKGKLGQSESGMDLYVLPNVK